MPWTWPWAAADPSQPKERTMHLIKITILAASHEAEAEEMAERLMDHVRDGWATEAAFTVERRTVVADPEDVPEDDDPEGREACGLLLERTFPDEEQIKAAAYREGYAAGWARLLNKIASTASVALTEEETFRAYARTHPEPEPDRLQICHPVCRDEWAKIRSEAAR
jgi:hypothetical protein